jgi:hypothetical protein
MSGKAIFGSDYNLNGLGQSGQATIAAGTNSVVITLRALTDAVKERNETAIMTLTNNVGYKLSTHPKATVTILDGP